MEPPIRISDDHGVPDVQSMLVVEDQPALLKLLLRRVRGCHVSARGAETLAAARAGYRPNLHCGLIVDVMLPDGSGFELIEEARCVEPALPILVMTGAAVPENITRAQCLGCEFTCKAGMDHGVRRFVRRAAVRTPAETWGALVASVAHRFRLTRAERRLLECSCESTRQNVLADRLGVSAETVKTQAESLREKIGAETLEALVAPLRRRALVR